ncbi:hypothetical protein EVAR_23972_1 [Eumeta japonica]|uniref:Uncharacterized protein n=1 Tax=Eumeta variegata TaxID=151549 RepID=A0A4C1V202_EUMVA|nr:hypothetical protein EVAR_23972_1 [Eumeta japonica]
MSTPFRLALDTAGYGDRIPSLLDTGSNMDSSLNFTLIENKNLAATETISTFGWRAPQATTFRIEHPKIYSIVVTPLELVLAVGGDDHSATDAKRFSLVLARKLV